MSKFLIEFTATNTTVFVEYDDLGLLTKFEMDKGSFTEHQVKSFNSKLPKKIEHLEWYRTETKAKIKSLEIDLSFNFFWDTYANKQGNKARAMKLWDKMKDVDKALALKWLPTYDTQLAMSKVAKLYPETYLNQKRWEN